jgi:hypothetical protein
MLLASLLSRIFYKVVTTLLSLINESNSERHGTQIISKKSSHVFNKFINIGTFDV